MNEFQIKSMNQVFRIKKMNAIEVLALRTQLDTENIEAATKLYMTILERIEVKVGEQWLPVRDGKFNIYTPAGIEENIEALDELIHYFMHEYLYPIFTKSDESKK